MNIYKIIEECANKGVQFGIISTIAQKQNQTARNIIDEHPWGTYGIDGKDPLKYVKLVHCDTEHLENILKTQPQITSLTTLVIMAILMERKEKFGIKPPKPIKIVITERMRKQLVNEEGTDWKYKS